MPQGLQVFHASGALKIDISHRLLRFIGDPIFIAPGSSGSVFNDGLLTGTPGVVDAMFDDNAAGYWPGESGLWPPTISFVGNRMDYSHISAGATHVVQMVVY